MINLKQNGSGQNINLSPIYQQIEVLDENTNVLSKRIDNIQTGTIDLSDIENSISSLNNSILTVQNDVNVINSNTSILFNDVNSIKTDIIDIQNNLSTLTLGGNYYETETNIITQRNFNYNIRDSNYESNTIFSFNNGLMNIRSTSFNTPYMSFECPNIVKNSYTCESKIILDCVTLSSCLFNTPLINVNAYYMNSNTCVGSTAVNGINANIYLGTNNSYSSFKDFNMYIFGKNSDNTFSIISHIDLKGNSYWKDYFTTCDFINYNCYDIFSNIYKNVHYINCVGKEFVQNTYQNQSDYPYQCQLMTPRVMKNKFMYPGLLNITCKMIDSNTISNANSVDIKCNYVYDNNIYNVRYLKIHNIQSSIYGFYFGINDLFIENFITKSTSESISNVNKFRFNNGSVNFYDSNLNWTLTMSNYELVESNVVHCGDFNPIPYIRSINKHLESIETKLTQSTSPESDVFVKKINIPNNIDGTTFTNAQSLKINCISVGNFLCSDIKSLKINGSNLESGMFSNIKSVEINAINCDELTFDNVDYIKISCTNTPDIYCSSIGTIKVNNYNKIQLQKFNLFEAPRINNYFCNYYMGDYNVNAPTSNKYDAHYMTDYTLNSYSYGTVKFKFNVDTYSTTGYEQITLANGNTALGELTTTNRLLFWKDNTFKMGNAIKYINENSFRESAYNKLMNYQIQFDMPYVTTSMNYQ